MYIKGSLFPNRQWSGLINNMTTRRAMNERIIGYLCVYTKCSCPLIFPSCSLSKDLDRNVGCCDLCARLTFGLRVLCFYLGFVPKHCPRKLCESTNLLFLHHENEECFTLLSPTDSPMHWLMLPHFSSSYFYKYFYKYVSQFCLMGCICLSLMSFTFACFFL